MEDIAKIKWVFELVGKLSLDNGEYGEQGHAGMQMLSYLTPTICHAFCWKYLLFGLLFYF
jgi:hypothetical protein